MRSIDVQLIDISIGSVVQEVEEEEEVFIGGDESSLPEVPGCPDVAGPSRTADEEVGKDSTNLWVDADRICSVIPLINPDSVLPGGLTNLIARGYRQLVGVGTCYSLLHDCLKRCEVALQDVDQSFKMYDDKIKRLEGELEELRIEKVRREEKLIFVETENNVLKEDRSKMRAEMSILHSKVILLEAKKAEALLRLSEEKRSITEVTNKLSLAEKRTQEAEEAISTIKRKANETLHDLSTCKKQVVELEGKNSDLQRDLYNANMARVRLIKENEEISDQVAEQCAEAFIQGFDNCKTQVLQLHPELNLDQLLPSDISTTHIRPDGDREEEEEEGESIANLGDVLIEAPSESNQLQTEEPGGKVGELSEEADLPDPNLPSE